MFYYIEFGGLFNKSFVKFGKFVFYYCFENYFKLFYKFKLFGILKKIFVMEMKDESLFFNIFFYIYYFFIE